MLFTILTAVAFVVRLGMVLAVKTGGVVGVDHGIYQQAAQRWVSGGHFYYPSRSGDRTRSSRATPCTRPLHSHGWSPGRYLPDLLWWAILIAVIAGVVVHHHPADLGVAVDRPLCVDILKRRDHHSGNPGLWIAMFVAIGTVWRPAFALVLLKPSLFVFALPGIRSRGWWVIAGRAGRPVTRRC